MNEQSTLKDQPVSQPGMDVVPKKQVQTATATPPVPQAVANSIQDPTTELVDAPIQLQPAPAMPPESQSQDEADSTQEQATISQDEEEVSEGSAEPAAPNQAAAPTKKGSSGKKPLLLVALVLVVGLGLAAVSVAAYMAANGDQAQDAAQINSAANEQAVTTDEPATPSEALDETTSEIDSTLKSLDSESDFSEAELTDEALEL